MTRRARWTRPFAALFALWFAVIIGDPGLLHACPMHGNHGGAHAAASSTNTHHAASMHQAATTSDAASHDASPHHGGSSTCTCVGQCCATPSLAPLPAVANLHVPATVALVEPVQRVALQPATAAPDLRLPFANGPPTA